MNPYFSSSCMQTQEQKHHAYPWTWNKCSINKYTWCRKCICFFFSNYLPFAVPPFFFILPVIQFVIASDENTSLNFHSIHAHRYLHRHRIFQFLLTFTTMSFFIGRRKQNKTARGKPSYSIPRKTISPHRQINIVPTWLIFLLCI